MKRFGLVLLAMAIGLSAACAAEELFTEEDFIPDAGASSEEFFSEEGFFGADTFALPEEEQVFEERSIVTIGADLADADPATLSEDTLKAGDEWWRLPPLLKVEGTKKAGAAKLTWAQDYRLTAPKQALPANVKYHIYRLDEDNGTWVEIATAKAAKAPQSVKATVLEGDHDVEKEIKDGIGGTITLKKQYMYAQYKVRAELVKKAKGTQKAEEKYGVFSNEVEYTGLASDAAWKTLSYLSLSFGNYDSIDLYWVDDMPQTDENNGYRISRTIWKGSAKTTENVPLIKSGEKKNYATMGDAHMLNESLPAGTTKVQYSVTPVKEGKSGKTRKSSTLVVFSDGWKSVSSYDFMEADSSTDTPVVQLSWAVFGSVADTYVISGLADKTAELKWDGKTFLHDSIDASVLAFELYWSDPSNPAVFYKLERAASIDTLYTGTDRDSASTPVTDEAIRSKALATLMAASDVNGYFSLYAAPKENKPLKPTIGVTPKKGGKKGTAAKHSAPLTKYWKTAPKLYGCKQISPDTVKLHLKPACILKEISYAIKGFAEPLTLTCTADSALSKYFVTVDSSTATAIYDEIEEVIIITGKVKKTGNVTITATAQRMVDGVYQKGRTSSRKVNVLKPGVKATVVIDSNYTKTEGLTFHNMNSAAVKFRLTVDFENGTERQAFDIPAKAGLDNSIATVTYKAETDSYNVLFKKDMSSGVGASIMIETFTENGTRYVDQTHAILGNTFLYTP